MADVWTTLPSSIRTGVETHIGPIASADVIESGQNNHLAAVLRGRDTTVFVKAVSGGRSRQLTWLRNEVTAGALAQGIAPAVLFTVEVDDWLVVAFEHVTGRPVDLTPGSPDLPLVAATMERLSTLPAKDTRGLRQRWTVVDWWSRLAESDPELVAGWDVSLMNEWTARAPAAVDGDRLAHTDLHRDQFLVTPGRVYVIDWGWPAAAAPWVDTAYMVIRLIGAGHTPAQAEAWAGGLSGWSAAPADSITAFSAFVAGLWTSFTLTNRSPGVRNRARIARDYAAWRIGSLVR